MIDILRDVILPELASSIPAAALPVTDEVFAAIQRLGAGGFTDPEAEYIRAQTRDGNLPRTPFPYGGTLEDVTWAFLQATGARPERREIEQIPEEDRRPAPNDPAASYPVDPLTGQLVFPINETLPSLNRQPGIILVPAGLFPICGTIILFGGQQLVGVSAHPDGGSVLLKYGDGACIRTQAPTSLSDDRHLSAKSLEPKDIPGQDGMPGRASNLILNPNADQAEWDRVRGLFTTFEARFAQMARNLNLPNDPPPDVHPADGPAWFAAPESVRKETLLRSVVTSEFPGYASVRVSRLRIEQQNWGPLVARPPIEDDELANPLLPSGYSHRVGGLRPGPLLHSSVGLDLVGCGVSIAEDLTIRGFHQGAGIRSVSRAVPAGSQFAYTNQIRHCHIENCHVGILMQRQLGLGFLGDKGRESEFGTRVGEGLVASDAGPNSTVMFACHISAEGILPRSGVEIWTPSCSVMFCSIRMPVPQAGERGLGGIVNLGQQTTVYRCRLQGGPRHILSAPAARFQLYPDGDGLRPDPSRFHLLRTSERVLGPQYVFYNRFFDKDGAITAPKVETVEFSANLGRLNVDNAFRNPPTRQALAAIPLRFVDASDERLMGFAPQVSLEVNSERRSLQTGWTSTNLLSNVEFMNRLGAVGDQSPAADWLWEWALPAPRLPPAMQFRHVQLAEPKFTGRAIEVTFNDQPMVQPRLQHFYFRLRQVLVAQPPPRPQALDDLPDWQDKLRLAWAARARYRGARLMGAVWAHASTVGSINVGFMEGDAFNADGSPKVASMGRTIWRSGDWVLLSVIHRTLDLDQYDWSGLAVNWEDDLLSRLGISFFVQVDVSLASFKALPPFRVLFGAPQVNLGPELFPLGPRPLVSNAFGAVTFARGFSQSERTTLSAGQRQGSSLIGIPSRLEKVFIDAEPTAEKQPSHFQVELLGEKGARPLCAFTVAPGGASEMTKGLSEEPALVPGDLVVTRLVGGPARAVDVYLQTVHSQVV